MGGWTWLIDRAQHSQTSYQDMYACKTVFQGVVTADGVNIFNRWLDGTLYLLPDGNSEERWRGVTRSSWSQIGSDCGVWLELTGLLSRFLCSMVRKL